MSLVHKVFGGFAVVLGAAVVAILEIAWLPLRAGNVLIPVSVVAAAVGNIIFGRLMFAVTRSTIAAVLPALAWLAVCARAAISTDEGDLLISDGGGRLSTSLLNLAFFLIGAGAAAYAIGTLRTPVATSAASAAPPPMPVEPAQTAGEPPGSTGAAAR